MSEFNPKMVRFTCTMGYRSDDGFIAKDSFQSKRKDPVEAMRAAADEMARVAELFGMGDVVETAVKDARQRVREWRARQVDA